MVTVTSQGPPKASLVDPPVTSPMYPPVATPVAPLVVAPMDPPEASPIDPPVATPVAPLVGRLYILPTVTATGYSALLPSQSRMLRYIVPAPVSAAPQPPPASTGTTALKYGGLSKSAFYRLKRKQATGRPVSRSAPYQCKLCGQIKKIATGHKQRHGFVYCPASGVDFTQWCVERDAKKKSMMDAEKEKNLPGC